MRKKSLNIFRRFLIHLAWQKDLELQAAHAYELIMDKIIANVLQILKQEKLVKSDDEDINNEVELPEAWTKWAEPKLSIDIWDKISRTIDEQLQAFQWLFLGKTAGKEAEQIVLDLAIKTKIPSGIIFQSFLGTEDVQRNHFSDILKQPAPEISNKWQKHALDFIQENTARYLDQSTTDLKNRMLSRLQTWAAENNQNSIEQTRQKAIEKIQSEQANLKRRKEITVEAIKEIFEQRASITTAKQALKDAVKDYSTNWNLVVRTEMGMASGTANQLCIQEIAGKHTKDPVVVILDKDDDRVSEFCSSHSRTKEYGGELKYFYAKDLKPAGYNIGKKKKEHKNCCPPRHFACFDNQTEVLTNKGWMLFKDIQGDEVFLSVDLDTGNAEWIKAIAVLSRKSKEIVKYKSHRLDLAVSPEHSHVIQVRKRGISCNNSNYLLNPWVLKEEGTLKNSDIAFCSTIPQWQGSQPDYQNIGEMNCSWEDYCEFMGYYLSEGNITNHRTAKGRDHNYQLKITQHKDSKHKMFECVKRVFRSSLVWVGKNSCSVKLNNIETINFFNKFGHSHQKYIPIDIKNSSKKYLDIFLQAYVLGDGTVRHVKNWQGYQWRDRITISTSSLRMEADLCEIILKLGMRPSCYHQDPAPIKHRNGTYTAKYRQYCIGICQQVFFHMQHCTKTIEQYNDLVYDVELEKYHTLFVRRNGKVTLSGNCRCQLIYVPPGFKVDRYGSLSVLEPGETIPIADVDSEY